MIARALLFLLVAGALAVGATRVSAELGRQFCAVSAALDPQTQCTEVQP